MKHIFECILFKLTIICATFALNLEYLDPIKLQTKTPANTQQDTALRIITKYLTRVTVEVNPILFYAKKDSFSLRTSQNTLRIKASSGVAAVWGFNYYLKKYCKSQIAWQVKNVVIPDPLPEVDEVVVASDRFRYYQNVCTASYSFVWWDSDKWLNHIEWMALNGINIALAPVAQEAAWARVYSRLGMTDDEIDEHFTGPAFLSWLRMGNMRGWGGPLPKSWHERQKNIQDAVLDYMFKLGMIPVLPAFSGHVPSAFARIFPNNTFHHVQSWNKFSKDYCCSLYVDPAEALFQQVGEMFLKEITATSGTNHIYSADPFNEIKIIPWSSKLIEDTSKAIFAAMLKVDKNAVWLLQNWMFVHDPVLWPIAQVKTFLTSVPNGRILVLDLQSEQWPQYGIYQMYFGQPFIWCMLHNFGGTLGMFGNMQTINKDVYTTRTEINSTMIGIGLTPEGINQNYVVYDLMLETAWRTTPVNNLNSWIEEYAERRYGCNVTGSAWRYLLKSVYSFNGLNKIRGKYVITRRPSLRIKPWAWYKSHDLIEAWKRFIFTGTNCNSPGFYHDLVDVTRQVLQYRAEQLYLNMIEQRYWNIDSFNASIIKFLDVMQDIKYILATNSDFTATEWFNNANSINSNNGEGNMYDFNARNQITLWGPNGEITDYACKQWAELFHYYYIPRWRAFLTAALDSKVRKEYFNERIVQNMVRTTVEAEFSSITINPINGGDPVSRAMSLFQKWYNVPGLEDLPMNIILKNSSQAATLTESTVRDDEEIADDDYTVVMLGSTTPL